MLLMECHSINGYNHNLQEIRQNVKEAFRLSQEDMTAKNFKSSFDISKKRKKVVRNVQMRKYS